MTTVLADTLPPEGKTVLTVHCGTPQNDVPFNFPNVGMVRAWDDGSLAAFDTDGRAVIFLRPGSHWGYLWQ